MIAGVRLSTSSGPRTAGYGQIPRLGFTAVSCSPRVSSKKLGSFQSLTTAAKCTEGVRKAVSDTWTPAKRSEVMSRIRSRDTLPERVMRAALRRQHVKYRSYRKVRGITVDLLLPDLHTVVLVHGCFWHGCEKHYTPPSDNASFWSRKLKQNIKRDLRQARAIRAAGWNLATVWQHSLTTNRDADKTAMRLRRLKRD